MSISVLSAAGQNGHVPDAITTEPLKDKLRTLWARILEQDESDILEEDIFFEIGGDSIKALELANAAQANGISLTVEEIFQNVTLEEMAQAILANDGPTPRQNVIKKQSNFKPFDLLQGNNSPQAQVVAIARACNIGIEKVENAYPCTPMQESLVSLSEGNENLSVRQLVYRMPADAQLDRFQQIWSSATQANPILRTRICQVEGQRGLTQAVLNERLSWHTSRTELRKYLDQDAEKPMLLGVPFWRYAIITNPEAMYFVWTVHHALCDGAALLGILDDVARRWQVRPAIMRAPFEKFVAFTLANGSRHQQDFWQQKLLGIDATTFPPVQQTIGFHVNPGHTLFQPLVLPESIPAGLTKALLLRAAWGNLLSYYTGTSKVAFGVINNGRNSSTVDGIAHIIGPTITLLPVVMQVDQTATISTFLNSVRTEAADIMPFEQAGMSKIRSYLSGRTAAAVTNFQTLFVVHPADFGEAGAPALHELGLEYIDDLGKKEQHAFPLVVSITLAGDRACQLKIQYDERILSAEEVQNLGHQYQQLLLQLGRADSTARLESVSPLSVNDLDQIRVWNQRTPSRVDAGIHDLFKLQVRKSPHAEAICSVDDLLTYAELDKLTDVLAVRLVDLGVHNEVPVAVSFTKSIWNVVAMYAVFKSGGFYVPIDPAHPRGRITEIIETGNITVGIVCKTGALALDGLLESIVQIDGRSSILSPSSQSAISVLEGRVQPTTTAYLLFTSGSTGKPKGVLIPHSAMATSITNHGKAFGAGPHWRTLQFAAHTFDISMTEFTTTLAFGGTVCVPNEEDRMNDLAGAITALQVNTALVVPTVANIISPEQVPTLKTLVLGGEPVTKETISRWANHVDLTLGYGPSECAVYSSAALNVANDAHPTEIGRSIGGTQWIVNPDDHNKLVPIGCVGELAITGSIVGNGYFGDRATTEKAFVPAPAWLKELTTDNEDQRMYLTGDLVRYQPDGAFRIIGRKDTQVKLRGFRIELGEIENRIVADGSVVSALAILPNSGPCSQQIVAVVCLSRSELRNHGKTTSEVTVSEIQPQDVLEGIRSRIALHLPDYMVPTIWIALDTMPLLISGKIDRRLLKNWIDQITPDTHKSFVRNADEPDFVQVPPGSIAESIKNIWADVLNVAADDIGLGSSFFALGGDSIAAITVVSKAKQVGLPLTVKAILTQKRLDNLAVLVKETQRDGPTKTKKASSARNEAKIEQYSHLLQLRLAEKPEVIVEDSYLFTPLQREILLARQINPRIFVLSWKMEFTSLKESKVSLERLAKAWNAVCQKQHIMRSIFVNDPNGKLPPLQVVLKNPKASIAISESEEGEHEPTIDELLPSLDDCFLPHRAHFSRRGNLYYGHIELDHLVIDGWSFRLLKEDLLKAYDDMDKNGLLPPPEYAFGSVVHALDQERVNADKEFWLDTFRDLQPSRLTFPTAPGSPTPPAPAKNVIYLPEVDISIFSAYSSKYSITAASIFDAAWAQTLSLYSNSPDVTYEYVVSGRDQDLDGVFDIVGPVMNVIAFHLRGVETGDSAQELANVAHQIQEQRLQDIGHTATNLRELIKGDLKRQLPFNTALNFQRRPLGVQSNSLRVHDHLRRSSDPWHFDILVRILHIMDDNVVRPSIEFDPRVFDETRMNEVATRFWSKVEIAFA